MLVREAKAAVRSWIEAERPGWPGLRAAHFVGSVTSMRDEADFPRYKDVDLHLVFETESPMLGQDGPPLLEAEWGGVLIEAGLKADGEYATAAAVLANPESAHHLTLDSVVYDPGGLLADLQPAVRREYAAPHWVDARLEHERRGRDSAFALIERAREAYGGAGALNTLGYTFTFAAAMLDVASVEAPSTGSGLSPRIERRLAAQGRADLYEELLDLFGLTRLTAADVERYLAEGADLFDAAATTIRRPHPFGHKLRPHLKPYFVESCRALLEQGRHREAGFWLVPYMCACAYVIAADGTAADAARAGRVLTAFFEAIGKGPGGVSQCDIARARRLHAAIEAAATAIARRAAA